MSGATAKDNLGVTAIKPIGWDRTGWEAFHYMLWNPDTGEVLTRTPLSWAKITIFYIIYYCFLTAFWVGSMLIFFQTLPVPEDGPRWMQTNSLIGGNPGLGLRPRNQDSRIDSQMFVLSSSDMNEHVSEQLGEGDLNADYAARVGEFMKAYSKSPSPAQGEFLGYKEFDPAGVLGDCGTSPYGYVSARVTPCVFFKLNNIWGWDPKPVDCGDPETNGADGQPKDECPDSVVAHMASAAAKAAGPDNIWIDCEGRNAADKEALEGAVDFYPLSRGLPISYYPYSGPKTDRPNKYGYHSPLVAIKLSPNPSHEGMLIHIECRAYYRGVVHDKKHKKGLVQFEVQLLG